VEDAGQGGRQEAVRRAVEAKARPDKEQLGQGPPVEGHGDLGWDRVASVRVRGGAA
jgi:hypothetical protein